MKLLLLVVCLVGCTTIQPTKLQNLNKSEAFLKMLYYVSSNNSTPIYDKLVTELKWSYISTVDNVHYYIERESLVLNEFNNTISFVLLSDNRSFKKSIMNEFGYSQLFDDKMPSFVSHSGSVDCNTKQSTVKWKIVMKANMIPYNQTYGNSMNPLIVKNSVSDSLCFTLNMIKR